MKLHSCADFREAPRSLAQHIHSATVSPACVCGVVVVRAGESGGVVRAHRARRLHSLRVSVVSSPVPERRASRALSVLVRVSSRRVKLCAVCRVGTVSAIRAPGASAVSQRGTEGMRMLTIQLLKLTRNYTEHNYTIIVTSNNC